jgi:hypothetical protein
MDDHLDIERTLRVWMADGPATMPDRVVDVVAARVAVNRQRRTWRVPWRDTPVNAYLKPIVAVAAVVLVAVVGFAVLGPRGSNIGGDTPQVTPTPTPSPTTAGRPWWLAGTDGSCGESSELFGCAGELAAGTHTSGGFRPAITYTVPAGWVNYRDWADYYVIFPDTPATRAAGGESSDHILVLPLGNPVTDCSETPAGSQDAALVANAFAALDPERPTPSAITIGGLSGKQVDLTVFPEFPLPCPAASPPPLAADGGHYRLIVLDTPSVPVAVVVKARDAADFDAFAASAMPIVESMTFAVGQ